MIEMEGNRLVFRFPEVHPKAECHIEFQRTLRIPDDNREYPLPPGLGQFPLLHTDDFAASVPPAWMRHGGVLFPMYQAEATWINFRGSYPFAVKVAAGKINTVTGQAWQNELDPREQDYLVVPDQPWLDSVAAKGIKKGETPLPGNDPVHPASVKRLHGNKHVVREGDF